MKSASKPRRILGISIRLHYTWILALALIAAIMVTQFPSSSPLWQRASLGIATGLLFFISITARELILNLIAIFRGIPVRRTTLFIFGGVPQTSKESTRPLLEILMAIAGLLTTLLICGIFYGICAALINSGNVVIAGIFQWLAFIYFMLFLFHIVPGFPLDGGRILRALLWRVSDNYERATRIVSWCGWAAGWICIALGILLMVTEQQWLNGLLLGGTGWVLQGAATQSRRQARLLENLKRIRAQDIMNRESPLIRPDTTISQVIQDYILATGHRHYIVADDNKFLGIATINEIKRVPKKRRGSHIGRIMTPSSELNATEPQQSAASLLGKMDELGIDYMPVLENDSVVGIVTRDYLVRLAQNLVELGM
jgi:Zn-dependent protease/CBS domain-containing protein